MIEIESKHLRKLNRDLQKISSELIDITSKIKSETGKVLIAGANEIRNDILRSMVETKRAPWFYIRQKGKKKHYPSMPGNPPAIDSGNMARSILYDVTSWKMEVGSIQTDPPYPEYHEVGIRKTTVGIKRPWLDPATRKNEPKIINKLEETVPEAIDIAMRKGGARKT